jgi:hypothetical protein
MVNKKAFVRYANNKAVPGSLIVRTKAPKVGTWKEVPYDLCCGGGGGTVQLVVGDIELPLTDVTGLQFTARCSDGPPYQDLKYVIVGIPVATINTYTDLINWLTTNYNYPGFTWLQTGPSTIEVVLDSGLLTENCQNPDQVFFNWIY